ncbi:NepR family anti-sigma factor [Rhodobacteraceae bacterium KMM 6894]|nr:NepR family anti-sigma factor [Rhodobacteraceae bacterium KMM 6894]
MAKEQPNARTMQQIDENLRMVFREKVEEELPDRFKDLLAQLKQQDHNSGTDGPK